MSGVNDGLPPGRCPEGSRPIGKDTGADPPVHPHTQTCGEGNGQTGAGRAPIASLSDGASGHRDTGAAAAGKESERLSAGTILSPWRLAGLPPRTPVLLALSGGADSRVLLHLLSACAERDGFSILLAHVHHGIRGAEADRDAAFCRSLAERYGWELEMLEADVPGLAKARRRGLEETAREVRYEFFERLMRERGIPLLATAHHADDQLETMLFRLCRGSGLSGLCGIAPVRAFAGGFLIRPLLPFPRREILACCEREGLTYVADSTNLDPSYARNRLRLRVVPELEAVAPDPQGGAYRLSRSLAQDRDYLDRAAEAFLSERLRQGTLPVEALRREHPAIRRRALAALSPVSLDAAHLESMEALALEGKSGSSCSLPGGMRACVQTGWLWVLPDLRGPVLREPVPLREGSFAICDGLLTVCVRKLENLGSDRKVHNLSTPRYIIVNENSDIMLGKGFWRCRQEGDALTVRGVHRRLRRLLREAGVPPVLRDALPLLCDRDGILWVPFVGARDGYDTVATNRTAGSGACYRVELLLHSGADPQQKGQR